MIWRIIAGIIGQDQINIPKTNITNNTFANVLQIVFGLAGAIALVSITLGALNYVLSQGDSSKLAKAKDTIMYSVIGLIVCLAAFSIVTFVIGKL
jgi:hypothetical protein